VKNTNFSAVDAEGKQAADDGISRYVISEYDLGLKTAKAYHVWDYNVNTTSIQRIHNRYIMNENKPNSTSAQTLWTEDKEKFPDSYYEELTYAPQNPYYYFTDRNDYVDVINGQCNSRFGETVMQNGEPVLDKFGEKVVYDYPAYIYQDFVKQTSKDQEPLTFNVTDRFKYTIDHRNGQTYYGDRGIDDRDNQKILTVNFVEGYATIDIEFPSLITCARQPNYWTRSTEIGGFFVLLDQEFARESSTSEIAAWTQYIYEGVGFYTVNGFENGAPKFEAKNDADAGVVNGIKQATLFRGNKGTIKIKDARSAKGDVIGFRVYAVNLDGTLYDPDGRAFYVKVGDSSETHTLNFDVTAYKAAGDTASQKENIVAYNTNAATNK
jgi:hypothetical protein